MTRPSEFIDVDKVERELVSALEADRKYSRENDAKFRAVHQKVATYEEFRDIVKASHLTCLDRDDITGRKERKQPWNPAASSSCGDEVPSCHGNTDPALPASADAKPGTVHTFMREWKHLKGSPEEQYLFLLGIGGQHLHNLFKAEISMGLLGEFITVLNLCFNQTGDGDVIMDILKRLAMCSRFKLALGFLSKDEKRASQQLCDKLRENLDNADPKTTARSTCLQELAKLYALIP